MPNESAVRAKAGIPAPPFGFFCRVRPGGRPPGRLIQPPDLFFQAVLLGQFKLVLARSVFPPSRKIPFLYLQPGAVEHQHMVHAAIQESPVVRDKDETLFAGQIIRRKLPARHVQVVGGLIDQEESVIPQKKQCQQEPCLLSVGKRAEGAVQHPLIQLQHPQLPQEPPLLQTRAEHLGHRLSILFRIRERKGEIVEPFGCRDRSGIHSLSHQEPQEGSLSPPVAPQEPQPPIGVQLNGHILKHRVAAAFIGEAQMRNMDQRHQDRPQKHKNRRGAATLRAYF